MRGSALIAVLMLAPGLLPAGNQLTWEDRVELTRGLTAEYATVKTLLPRSSKPLVFDVNNGYDKNQWTEIGRQSGPAARTGDLQTVLALMRAGGNMPIFSHTQKQDPAAYWKESYPDSDGLEILSILVSILETPPVRIEAGTPQEAYVWPYFARLPVKSLTPAQKVDLFRVVTGADYKEMLERGRYVFYQVGIGPDGSWRYFLASE